MADDDVDDISRKVDKSIEMAIGRLRDSFSKETLDKTDDRMRGLKREIEDMMHGLHSSDKQERDELRAELAKVQQFMNELKEASSRSKNDDGTTIVVPASQIDEHNEKEGASQKPAPASIQEEAPKRSFWKSVW